MRTRRFRLPLVAAFLGVGLAVPSMAAAAQPSPLTVTITSVTTVDCYAVQIAYHIGWTGMAPPTGSLWASDRLWTYPSHTTLAEHPLNLARRANRIHRGTMGQDSAPMMQAGNSYVRESGYFDHQTYSSGEIGYQVVVFYRNADGSRGAPAASSNAVAIPNCVPLSPTSGPAAGGTTVTAYGGATFGGDGFGASTTVTVGSATVVPTSVSADGRSLTFATPPGTSGSCVIVATNDPGLPFSLPDFCYAP
jgi:IPT/TIG domain-containing protein